MATISLTQDSPARSPGSVKSDDTSPQRENNRGSPPPNCAICLGTCRNKCFTDSCLHQFCFKCLLTWSKVKAECPLCKQNFKSIIHNVRPNQQYDEYTVEQRHTAEDFTEMIDIDNLTSSGLYRYRTTLTLPRRDTLTIQQLLMQYPLMGDMLSSPPGPLRLQPRAPPSGLALPPTPPSLPPPPPPRRRSPASFRRTVYRHNLWARPLPDFTGRYRDCTPEFYRYNYTQMQRLVPWINRELYYLLNENAQHISYVIGKILELLPQYRIESREFREAMHAYFGDRTDHFLHELRCFASTPYDLAGYDRNVQYTTDTRMVNEVISSSESDASVDSDIVVVSSSEPSRSEPPAGPSRGTAPPVYPLSYIPQPSTSNVITIETFSHSESDDDTSEVMVVGYIKPPQERTPEIVDLLESDSDVILQENTQSEPLQDTDEHDMRSQPLVKLSLKRHAPQTSVRSESEDSTYTPPMQRRRRRRPSPAPTAPAFPTEIPSTAPQNPAPLSPAQQYVAPLSPAQPCPAPLSPATPPVANLRGSDWSPALSTDPYSYINTSSDSTTISYHSDTSTTCTSCDERKKKKKKSRRKTSTKAKKTQTRKKSKNQSSSSSKDKKKSRSLSRDKVKSSKKKSHSGKRVKKSKNSETVAAPEALQEKTVPVTPADPVSLPSTSGVQTKRKSSKERNRRRTSREGRENLKLRSVVNLMNKSKTSTEASTSGSENSNLLNILAKAILNPKSVYNSDSGSIPGDERTSSVPPEILEKAELCFNVNVPETSHTNDGFDSEDDFPLNLTIQKPKKNS